MKTLFVLVLCAMSTLALAQKPKNTIIADSVKYSQMQLEGLGLKVLSYEDEKHVLINGTGRYIIKGTVTDMWDGVKMSQTFAESAPPFPDVLNKEDIMISFGNEEGEPVLVYLSYSCLSCAAIIDTLLSDQFIAQHRVSVVLVHNNDHDEFIAQNVFCAKDKVATFKRFYLDRDTSDMDYDCQSVQPDFNTKLAIAQKVKALPATYYPSRNQVRFGTL